MADERPWRPEGMSDLDIEARTLAAQTVLLEQARAITARAETASSADAPHDLEVVAPLADLEGAYARQDQTAFLIALATFWSGVVRLKDRGVINL